MFSSSVRLLVRTRCFRSLYTISSAPEQHLLNVKPNFTKYLAGNLRCITDRPNPLAEIDPDSAVKESAKKERRKTPPVPKITLFDTNMNMTVCSMEEAEKLALGKHLRLVKILDVDLQTKRPVYKLMTEAQYLEEELKEKQKVKEEKKKNNSALKGEKILIMSARINENDMQMKLSKVAKWIDKKFEVRITISGPEKDLSEQEKAYKEFEKVFQGNARFLQKRVKGGDIKFQLVPTKEALQGNAPNTIHLNKKSKVIEVDDEDEEKPEEPQSQDSSKTDELQNVFSKV